MDQFKTILANFLETIKTYVLVNTRAKQAKDLQKVASAQADAIGADGFLVLETDTGEEVRIPAESFTKVAKYFESLLSGANGSTVTIQKESDSIDFMVQNGIFPEELVESAQEAIKAWNDAKAAHAPKARKS